MNKATRFISRGVVVVALAGMAAFGAGHRAQADTLASKTFNETINQNFNGTNFPLTDTFTITNGRLSGTNGQDPTEGCTFNTSGGFKQGNIKLVATFVSGPCTGVVTTFTGKFNPQTGNGKGNWTNTVGNSGPWTAVPQTDAAAVTGTTGPNVR